MNQKKKTKSEKEIPALLLAGGRPRDPAVMARIMSSVFREIQKPEAAYIGTANGDDPGFFKMLKSLLMEAGAEKVVFVHLAKENADVDAARKSLASSNVIFLAGGEVEEGMMWLEKHGLCAFLKDLYRAGKCFMGISAGVIMMGTQWVRWSNPDDDATAELFDCLGIVPVLFDVHGEEEDWAELKAALELMGGGARGYGLPSGCIINADSQGVLVNLEKKHLVFVNEGGRIRVP